MLGTVVFNATCNNSKEVEIGMGHLGTTDVCSSIAESRLKTVESCRKEINDGLLLLLSGGIVHKRISFFRVIDVHQHSVEPLRLIEHTGGGGRVAVLVCEGLQDSKTLRHISAIFVDPDGELGITVGSRCLHGSPLFKADDYVLKGDVLGSQHVADGLCAVLGGKVNKLWHRILF